MKSANKMLDVGDAVESSLRVTSNYAYISGKVSLIQKEKNHDHNPNETTIGKITAIKTE